MKLFKKSPSGSCWFVLVSGILFFFIFSFFIIGCQSEPDDTVNAQQPSISVQPVDVFWNVHNNTNPINLSVTSNVTDGGKLTYQWYSNTSKSTSGSQPVAGGTDETLSLNKSNYTTNGSRNFYVVVTNTNNDVDGNKTASITSAAAEVVVVGYPDAAYTTSAIPENLKGTWTYDWGGGYIEKYIIDETTFTSEYTYAGTIIGHRSNNDGDGYITIKFTENYGYVDSENMFYVIHYKDLSISEVTLAGAWLGADPDFEYGVGPGGKATQAEAETVMTVSAGYFGMYSSLSRDGDDIPSVIIPENLKGTWESIWGEEYIISAATFTSGYGGSVSYAGTIVAHNADGADAGYITIKYTENSSYTNSTGKFYVIHYKYLTSSTFSVSGANLNTDPDFDMTTGSGGKTTQEEAESTMTVADGYFSFYSACYKFSGDSFTNKMQGEWAEEDYGMIVTITDNKVIVAMDYMGSYTMTLFIGEIVKVKDDGATGYIVFKCALIDSMSGIDDDVIGTYTVLYWKNYSDDSADMAIGDSDWMGFDGGEASIAAAENKYINGTYNFDDDLLEFERQ